MPRSVEETAEDGGGNQDGGDVDGDGMASSGNTDSMRVDGVQLAGEAGQHEKPNDKMKRDVPVSSRPPICPTDRPYGPVRCRRQRGRIKFEAVSVSVAQEHETAYMGRMGIAQQSTNESKRSYGVIGPWRRHISIKIEPVKASQPQEVKTAYWICTCTAQPPRNDPKWSCRVIGLVRWRRRHDHIKIEPVKVKIECISVNQAQEVKNTYQIHARTVQPLGNPPEHCYGVHRPCHRRGHMKIGPKNIS